VSNDLQKIISMLSDTIMDKIAASSVVGQMAELKEARVRTKDIQPPQDVVPNPEQLGPFLKEGVKLTESQNQFTKFISDREGIGVAAWKPGSGKTLGAIAAYMNLRKEGRAGKAIVLVPASLRVNFAEGGVAKFTTGTYGIIGTRQESKAIPEMDIERMGDKDFYIVSHDLFRANPDYYLEKTGADTIIMDEMQRIKDPQSVLNDVIEKVGQKVKNFIGATATPAMNKPFEAIELRNAISQPGERLSEEKFTKKFIQRAPEDFWNRVQGWFGGELKGEITGFKKKEELAKLLTKSFHFAAPSSANTPSKELEIVETPMTASQEANYHAILKKKLTTRERRVLEEGKLYPDREMVKILNKAMAIRQLSNNAKWVEGAPDVAAAAQTPKILRMMNDVEEHLSSRPDAKIIIASNFVGSGAKMIEALLKQKGISYGTYYGKGQKGVTSETRQKAIKDYRAGKVKIMIMTGAGAEGLDLPNTTMHMTMDPHYNPERITQQEARGIRRGGQKHLPPSQRRVIVRRYISVPSKGFSIDKSIYTIAAKKKALVDQLKEIGLRAQQRRAESDPSYSRALSLFARPTKPKIEKLKKPEVLKPQKPVKPTKLVKPMKTVKPQGGEMRKSAMEKFSGNGGYLNARGSFDEHEVRLIGGNGTSNLISEPAMDASQVLPHNKTQSRLPGKWSKRRKSSLTGKEKARMAFTPKTEGALGPNENKEGPVRVGY